MGQVRFNCAGRHNLCSVYGMNGSWTVDRQVSCITYRAQAWDALVSRSSFTGDLFTGALNAGGSAIRGKM